LPAAACRRLPLGGLLLTLVLLPAAPGCGGGGDDGELEFKPGARTIRVPKRLTSLRGEQAAAARALARADSAVEIRGAVLRLAKVTDRIADQVGGLRASDDQKRALRLSEKGAHRLAADLRAAAAEASALEPDAARRFLRRRILASEGTAEVRRANRMLRAATPGR
jgi:hypothetical protein